MTVGLAATLPWQINVTVSVLLTDVDTDLQSLMLLMLPAQYGLELIVKTGSTLDS